MSELASPARPWHAPSSPATIYMLLEAFKEIVLPISGPVMVSSCPAWFDDCGFFPRQVVRIGDSIAQTSDGWWDDVGQGITDTEPTTADRNQQAREKRIEKELKQGFPHAQVARDLFRAINKGGPLDPEKVEDATISLENTEIVAFHKDAEGEVYLCIEETNGWTNVTYTFSAENVCVWIDTTSGSEIIKDDNFPAIGCLSDAIVLDGTQFMPVSKRTRLEAKR